MDDKHLHIDEWLKKAAAQDPAPEDTGMELKQQAWSRMAALLEEEDGKPQPRLFRFRLNWAAILISFVTLSAVAAVTVFLIHRQQSAKQPSAPPPGTTALPGHHTHKQSAANDTPYTYIQEQTQPAPADTLTMAGSTAGAAGKRAAETANSAGPRNNANYANNANNAAGGTNAAAPAPASSNIPRPLSAEDRKAAKTKGPGTGNKRLTPTLPRNKQQRALPDNKVNKAASSGREDDNEPLAYDRTSTGIRHPENANLIKAPEETAAVLYPLPTHNVFALQLPSLSSASRSQRVGAYTGRGLSMAVADSRWALQAGLLSSLNSAFGARLGVLYVYHLNDNWYLQPQLSVSYMRGYDKAFTHLSRNQRRVDSLSGNFYDLDSITTPYTLKSTIAGAAGINAGYHKNRINISTGLVYSYARASGNRDSSRTRTLPVNDSLGVHQPFSNPAFSTGSLPGMHQLNWNIDFSYYLLPRLQLGINYRVMLLRSQGDKGFQVPIQRIQDNSQLELYIRIPIGK
jgi:hypothetical protein